MPEIVDKSVTDFIMHELCYIIFIFYRNYCVPSPLCYDFVKIRVIPVTIFYPIFLCTLHIEVCEFM